MEFYLTLCMVLALTYVQAVEIEERRSKLPFIADAVGNTFPPPFNAPATVGSPVNLLTPDRYEFYTFDESGELVKKLMTLEEIQAIVAAGEETEGLVTFVNENKPTVAFNFSQPYNKVHNVVTNVQNVLKAQMEAHKNKPVVQPTLDTPDVSDSWSLILPSIFGNTGVDIVPDKSSGTFSTPETETIEVVHPKEENEVSDEGDIQVMNSSPTVLKDQPINDLSTEKTFTTKKDINNRTTQYRVVSTTPTASTTTTTKTTTTSTTTTTTTPKPTTTTKNIFPSTSNVFRRTTITSGPRPLLTTTTKPRPLLTTTAKPKTTITLLPRTTTTTTKPRTSSITTTVKPQTTVILTTLKPKSSTTTTRLKSTITTTTTPKPVTVTKNIRTTVRSTTARPYITTKKHSAPSTLFNVIKNQSSSAPTAEIHDIQYEKISTFSPVSTASYVTERITKKTVQVTNTPIVSSTIKLPASSQLTTSSRPQSSITTNKPFSTTQTLSSVFTTNQDVNKANATTITTQSISSSTTVTSTELITAANADINPNNILNEPVFPLFDVAQSISQIATDLGNYRPMPTTSNNLDNTQIDSADLESKENSEIDIPEDAETNKNNSNITDKHAENFVKISTLNPPSENEPQGDEKITIKNDKITTDSITIDILPPTTVTPKTTIDPILSNSMHDLLSQIVHQSPQSIINNEQNMKEKDQTVSIARFPEVTKNKTIVTKTTNASNKIDISIKEEHLKKDTVDANKIILNRTYDEVQKQGLPINNEISKQEAGTMITSEPNTEKKGDITVDSAIFSNTTQNNDLIQTTPIALSYNKNEQKEIINSTIHKVQDFIEAVEKETHVTATAAPKIIEMTTLGTVSNKVSGSINVNKIVSNNKETFPDFSPKIDDFKKKIQKVNIDDKEFASDRNNSWKLISTVSPPGDSDIQKDQFKVNESQSGDNNKAVVLEISKENKGLEVTTKDLGEDIAQFTQLCNELAFRYWNKMVENIDKRRSFVFSPYSITSMLAMIFMGAKGATSGEINEILKLDDMVTFNPHFILKNISDSIVISPEAGVVVSAFVKELYSDRNRGKILTFYKERALHFYNGYVEEINFKLVSDIIRRRTNLLMKRYTWGRITEYMKANTVNMQPPLAAFSANVFQTDCTGSSVEGRDGEMYFVVSPNVRQRRLVPVPAVVYRSGFLAGYDPILDATAVALGNTNSIVSTLFLMPGQQGSVVHAEDLETLEKRFLDSNPTTSTWNRLLRALLPRIGLELQIPRFSHKSIFNVSSSLKTMGLKDLFDSDHADLGGLNGPSKDLFLSDMVQSTTFVTCGEGVIADQHHIEEYPESLEPKRRRSSRWVTGWDEPRDYQRAFHDPHDVGEAMNLPLHLRPRQARLPSRNAQPARLKFDRPFLFVVRHNPSGMILYVGRYNPRLLP